MNSTDSGEVGTDLVPQPRTWEEGSWVLVIRNFEKEVWEWTSQNGSRLENMVYYSKPLQTEHTPCRRGLRDNSQVLMFRLLLSLTVAVLGLGYTRQSCPQFLRVDKIRLMEINHPPSPGSPVLSQQSHKEGGPSGFQHICIPSPQQTRPLPAVFLQPGT